MVWSTTELAELAGTTVKTVRHYHRIGLLDEPERLSNGYKQYRVRHLIGLLRIRRLAELGVPLGAIEGVRDGGHGSSDALRAIDAELAADIDRRLKARADIAAILRESAPADVPAGFESVASRLSEADRSLIHVYGQMYDEDAMKDLRRMVELEGEPDAVSAEFDALTADADDAARRRVAEGLAPKIARHLAEYPWLTSPAEHLSKSERVAQQMFVEAAVELYNAAQLDVIGRATLLAFEELGLAPDGSRDGVPSPSTV